MGRPGPVWRMAKSEGIIGNYHNAPLPHRRRTVTMEMMPAISPFRPVAMEMTWQHFQESIHQSDLSLQRRSSGIGGSIYDYYDEPSRSKWCISLSSQTPLWVVSAIVLMFWSHKVAVTFFGDDLSRLRNWKEYTVTVKHSRCAFVTPGWLYSKYQYCRPC